jgi:hypothetical protein
MPLEQHHSHLDGCNLSSIDDTTKAGQYPFPSGTCEVFLAQAHVQEATESFDYMKLVRTQR